MDAVALTHLFSPSGHTYNYVCVYLDKNNFRGIESAFLPICLSHSLAAYILF